MKLKLAAVCAGLCFSLTALAANPRVEMKTNLGNMTLELYPDRAPIYRGQGGTGAEDSAELDCDEASVSV